MPYKKFFRIKVVVAFLAFALLFTITLSSLIFINDKYSPPLKTEIRSDTAIGNAPIVVIDAGHGGEDGGAIGKDGSLEKNINLNIAKMLSSHLRAKGINTIMTRDTDTLLYDKNADYEGRKKALDLAERLRIANSYEGAIFVSIHMNSFPQAKYKGLQVYYSKNDTRSASLAENIQSFYKNCIMPENQRQIKQSDGKIAILDKLRIPAVLVECGFLSNPEECAKLNTESYQNELAKVMCDAIFEYFNQCENQNVEQTQTRY